MAASDPQAFAETKVGGMGIAIWLEKGAGNNATVG
jgi:hypothetical protein